jgi:hypothetical protein
VCSAETLQKRTRLESATYTFQILIKLIQRRRGLLEKLIGTQVVNKFRVYCGTWRLVTIFTRTRHYS